MAKGTVKTKKTARKVIYRTRSSKPQNIKNSEAFSQVLNKKKSASTQTKKKRHLDQR